MTDITMSNKKNKNKKSCGRTGRDEDDIDKILAEIGEGPSVSKQPIEPRREEEEEKADPEPELGVQSAAAKKRKKRKEKEKEKRAAAPDETKADDKAVEKKVSKGRREIREAIARRTEAEERRKREEEERRRKEEEELRRQEELERQAEEARRRKKEKEKEKKLKKKQEGKLLTPAQKEKARRMAAMKEQILARSNLPSGSGTSTAGPTKRPSYGTKKSKQTNHQETVTEAALVEPVRVGEAEPVSAGNDSYIADDDEDEWDAKSWDDVNISVSGSFTEEEHEADSELRETNSPASSKPTGFLEVKPQEVEAAPESKASCSARTPNPSGENLRSPICCIMGHVDAGKTKLLDCIRGTNVQEGEAGGITQQIGATYFPTENIRERTKELKPDATLKVPGLLIIDTPGHGSFTNLRSRGAGLCDISVLVVDIMSGLAPQTIESLNLLKMRNTPFIVALNKVDRIYGWKTYRNVPMNKAMKQQTKDVQDRFDTRLIQIITQFKEQGLNTDLYYSRNKGKYETISIVPTSAVSGEGIPELLLLLVQSAQRTMVEKLTFSNEVQCTVLEVKVVEGHGTTIDVVLVNGVLHEGDQIVVCGLQGPIVTTIRALLTPHPQKELRVKGSYLHHKEIKAAQGIKISAQGSEHAVAGTGLYVLGPEDDLEHVKEVAMDEMMSRIDLSREGVRVHASTLGSLEALLEFLKTPGVSVPVSGVSIGPVHKKDVSKASTMLKKKKEYAAILAFDVKVTPEAQEDADEKGVKVFRADVIYRLFDQFKAYIDNVKEEKKREAADEAVFPCELKIVRSFRTNDPILLGVEVVGGTAKVGTPLCIQRREEFVDIGRIASIKINNQPLDEAHKSETVCVKIVGTNVEEKKKEFGRHFGYKDLLISHLSRKSIDILNEYYLDDLSKEEKQLAVRLKKKIFRIQ